jgi:hypothetical protein
VVIAEGGGEYDPKLNAEALRAGLVLGGCTASDKAYKSGQCQSLAKAAGQESIKAAAAEAGGWSSGLAGGAGTAAQAAGRVVRPVADALVDVAPFAGQLACYAIAGGATAGTGGMAAGSFLACSFIVGSTAIIISFTKAADRPSSKNSASAVTAAGGYVCTALGAAGRLPAASELCSKLLLSADGAMFDCRSGQRDQSVEAKA